MTFTAYQNGNAVASYRSESALVEDLGVTMRFDTYRSGALLRNGQAIGAWARYTAQQYI